MTKVVWIDVETTGLDPETRCIIEIAALFEGAGQKSIFHTYILPDELPTDFDIIEEITGITWEYLQQKGIPEAEAYKQFTEWLGKYIDKYDKEDKAIFAAYNADFDFNFIHQFFNHNKDKYLGSWFLKVPLDIMNTVMQLVRFELIPIPPDFKNSTTCSYFGIEHKAHSAIDDIKASRSAQLEMEKLLREMSNAH